MNQKLLQRFCETRDGQKKAKIKSTMKKLNHGQEDANLVHTIFALNVVKSGSFESTEVADELIQFESDKDSDSE